MRFKHLILFTIFSSVALASGGETGETDILYRTVNFVIFAAILYYLLAEPAKNFFTGRSQAIADELNSVQEKLKESKSNKEKAVAMVDDAKKMAEEILATTKKENTILVEKINTQLQSDLSLAEAQHNDLKRLEENKMVREVVEEVIVEMVSGETLNLSKEAVAELIMKKVA